jgi:hypothetical protein
MPRHLNGQKTDILSRYQSLKQATVSPVPCSLILDGQPSHNTLQIRVAPRSERRGCISKEDDV